MYKKFLEIWLFGATVFAFPAIVSADIKINEVAWMGTTNSQYEEWIELYNDGADTSLSGYKIYKAGGSTLLINLSGNISAGGYLLVCRTTPSVPSPLSGSCGVNGSFGGSGLNNSSEHIVLKDDSGTTIDSINASSGWPAGDASSKQTMQLNGSSWITASATPGTVNATSGSGSGNNSEDNNEQNEEESGEGEESLVVSGEGDTLPELKIYSNRLLKVEYPKTAIVKTPAHFRAQALDYDRSDIFKGYYTWNMGDGTIREFALGYRETNNGFHHTYEHPGTYSVNVKYYTSFFEDMPPALEESFTIEVETAKVIISKVYPDGGVELKNTSGNILDLSGWQLRDFSGRNFIFPEGSKINANKSSVFPSRVTKLNVFTGVSLFTPINSLVGTSMTKSPVVVAKTSSTKKSEEVKTEGEVLGTSDQESEEVVKDKKEKDPGKAIVWILSFIILILLAVISVIFLNREKAEVVDGYELIDE